MVESTMIIARLVFSLRSDTCRLRFRQALSFLHRVQVKTQVFGTNVSSYPVPISYDLTTKRLTPGDQSGDRIIKSGAGIIKSGVGII